MDKARRKELKRAGKAEVEARSADLQRAMKESISAPLGSDEWMQQYRQGNDRERIIREHSPFLVRREAEEWFVVIADSSDTWRPHPGSYVQCNSCGDLAPSDIRPRFFYWKSCSCGNIVARSVLWLVFGGVKNGGTITPVKLIGRGQ